ncbi:MAG: hypothetical protein N2378_11175 [Chloroflexaceae bacterium]|nr:hypothetical protein [Chloroflexaceae bacterium]
MRTSTPTPWYRKVPIRSALAALLIALVALTATSAVYAVAYVDPTPPGGSTLPDAIYGYPYPPSGPPVRLVATGTITGTQFFIVNPPPVGDPPYNPPLGARLPTGIQIIQDSQTEARIATPPGGTVTEPATDDPNGITFAIGVTGEANQPPGSGTVAARGYRIRVQRAPLTIRAVNQSRVYGDPNSTLTYTVEGLRNGDTAGQVLTGALATEANPGSPAGTYAITQGTLRLTDYGARRYTVNFVPGTLTVTRAPLTVVASGQSREYGQADPTLSYTANLRNGDRVDQVFTGFLGTTATVNSPVGTYPITQGSLALSGYGAARYTLNSFVPSTLTVTRAPLTVVANNRSRTYGAANPSLTYTANLRGGDTLEQVLTGSLVTSTTITSPVGNYPINQGTLSLSEYGADRYTLTFEPGTLAIIPAPLTVRANDASRPFGNPNPPFTVNYTGFVNGEGLDVLQGELSFTTTATESSPPGAYPIVPSGLTSPNYSITYVEGTLRVTTYQIHLPLLVK